jgi:hypothetical protein
MTIPPTVSFLLIPMKTATTAAYSRKSGGNDSGNRKMARAKVNGFEKLE